MAVASDAEGITALADGCVMVVRQNEAVAPALNKAIAALEGNRAKLLGCVLNNVHSSPMGSGSGAYGYGGYYKYGKYGHYGYGSYGSRK
jgi:Mrp family chromosome partitioning ATPase